MNNTYTTDIGTTVKMPDHIAKLYQKWHQETVDNILKTRPKYHPKPKELKDWEDKTNEEARASIEAGE